jgi:glycosyltransferase involved in cell wall biosynthesis
MDFVFVHGNYPAQFRMLARALAANAANRVYYLTARKDADKFPIPNVTIIHYEPHRKPHKDCHPYLTTTEEAVLQGQAVLRALLALQRQGVRPAVIITHGGNGLGFFVKQAAPNVRHITYMEWFFRPETSRYLFKDFDINEQLTNHLRNLSILSECESADTIVVPTQWQRSQLPSHYSQKAHLIFDGVDVSFFKPQIMDHELVLPVENKEIIYRFPPDCRLLTYVTRGMETLRGFPEFMRMLPTLMEAYPDLRVIVAGQDRCAYSYGSPSRDRSWKTFMLEELEGRLDTARLFFTGLIPYTLYRDLLNRSDLHCYFTRPYVTSWSLFEAAACGARLMVNRSPATEGILADGDTLWVDLDDQDALTTTALQWLKDSPARRIESRSSILLPGFTLSDSLSQWNALLKSLLSPGFSRS